MSDSSCVAHMAVCFNRQNCWHINCMLLSSSRMALGMFDPTHLQPYLNISTDQINSPAHQVS